MESLRDRLFKGKTILLLGARRVGKTFLCKSLVKEFDGIYYNCDEEEVKELMHSEKKAVLSNLIQGKKLCIFDEAQTIPNIGMKIKILHDSFPEVQFLATGSASFDLIHKTSEPLTGRSRQYIMYTLSFSELAQTTSITDVHGNLDQLLRYGSYPEVLNYEEEDKVEELQNITSNYLYRDMLMLGDLKKPALILDILRLLAHQIGSEVSLNKLANKTNSSVHTIQNYIEMLEKSFVLFSLPGFSRNLRKEVGKSRKYYFYDLGIRNSIIRNFNPLDFRNDVGMLWENFCIIERMKHDAKLRKNKNRYFWRTYDQQEIDYLEEYDGKLEGYEMKYTKDKIRIPAIFLKTYENSSIDVVNRENYLEFLL